MNVVEKRLHLVPQTNHSKDQRLGHAPLPSICMNLEDQSLAASKEYGKKS